MQTYPLTNHPVNHHHHMAWAQCTVRCHPRSALHPPEEEEEGSRVKEVALNCGASFITAVRLIPQVYLFFLFGLLINQ